jgi:peroxiredoxin
MAGLLLFASQVSVDLAEGFNPPLLDKNIGAKAPDFTLKDMSGKEVALSSFRGKPVLLNFWATWCPYCRKERDHLNKLHGEYKEKGLIILSVSTDQSVRKVKSYLKKVPAEFIVLSDSKGRVSSSYNVGGLPTSVLIDREGFVRQKLVGFREWTSSSSRQLIDKLIDN